MRTKARQAALSQTYELPALRAAIPRRYPTETALPAPAVPEAQPISLLTVASSSIATSDDNSTVVLVLKTEEAGPVAFQVTVEACAVLRCQIAIAEGFLSPRKVRSDRRGAALGCASARPGA
jgi:hypothetical protein